MKQKPQGLNYFSLVFVLMSGVALQELIYSWQLETKNDFQLFSACFLVVGLWAAHCAWRASPTLFIALATFWSLCISVNNAALADPSVKIYQLFAFDLWGWLLVLQTAWFCLSFCRIFSRPARHWWKTPKRVSIQLKAIVRTKADESYLADVHNLSTQGLLIGVKERVPGQRLSPGDSLNLHFVVGPQKYVRCVAVVVHARSSAPETKYEVPCYGVKVTRIDELSKKHLEKFVQRHMG